jgi:hypothetical protein
MTFQRYPNVRTEPWFDRYARDARRSLRRFSKGATLEMWITDDAFSQVVGFYKALGVERSEFTRSIARNHRTRIGRDVHMTHVILDGAASPVSSKHYVTIQFPVVVSFEPLEVHDVTAIARYRTT